MHAHGRGGQVIEWTMEERMDWKTWLLPLLTEDMRQALAPLELPGVTELRLRLGKPMEVVTAAGSRLLYAPNGRPMLREGQQEGLLLAFCNHARYAWEKEIQQGFITLNSGCRVGITGRIAADTGAPAMVTGFCIRILRPVVGCGEGVLPGLLAEGRLRATLLYSAPGCGKTTLLRDLIRLLSNGLCGASPHRVGVVDERFEIGGEGGMAFDLGDRTDVLSYGRGFGVGSQEPWRHRPMHRPRGHLRGAAPPGGDGEALCRPDLRAICAPGGLRPGGRSAGRGGEPTVKLLAGIALFLLCALVGEGKSRRLAKRERTLSAFCKLIREIGERQQSALVSFREGALMSPPSPEREALLELAGRKDPDLVLPEGFGERRIIRNGPDGSP